MPTINKEGRRVVEAIVTAAPPFPHDGVSPIAYEPVQETLGLDCRKKQRPQALGIDIFSADNKFAETSNDARQKYITTSLWWFRSSKRYSRQV